MQDMIHARVQSNERADMLASRVPVEWKLTMDEGGNVKATRGRLLEDDQEQMK